MLRIATETVNAAAAARGFSAEEYVSRLATISAGRRVCAHLMGTEANGSISVFSLS